MPIQDVHAIIKKAVSDDTFRMALHRSFNTTIASHSLDLTKEESDALIKVDWSKPLPSNTTALAGTWVHVYKSNPSM